MNAPTLNGHSFVYVVGFASDSSGGFEWDIYRERIEAVRVELLERQADDGTDITDIRQVDLATLELESGDRDTDEITDALDSRPELWEPPYSVHN